MQHETIYGSVARLNWFKTFLTKDHTIVDIGCGTGHMVTIPLMREGFNVVGIDLDEKSIAYGRSLLKEHGIAAERLLCREFSTLNIQPDVVILSEVLEHLTNEHMNELMQKVVTSLKPEGLVLITVPHGYGWFEIESFLWNKLGLGWLLEKTFVIEGVLVAKNKILGRDTVEKHPSSLDSSPHIQRFTCRSLEQRLQRYGLACIAKRGGSFISGPLSNLLFTGIRPVMKMNMVLGRLMPVVAADFYIAMKKQ